jgi:hypothetical protein
MFGRGLLRVTFTRRSEHASGEALHGITVVVVVVVVVSVLAKLDQTGESGGGCLGWGS